MVFLTFFSFFYPLQIGDFIFYLQKYIHMITIHLPVSKPMYQFLTAKFGEEYQPTKDNWFGILINSLLSKKNSNWDCRKKEAETFEYFYKINISLSYSDKHGLFFTKFHEDLIRRSVETIFREHLYEQAILNKRCYEIDYKTSIENALALYGVDEGDKSYYQTIMRDFTRKKEAISQRLRTKNNFS